MEDYEQQGHPAFETTPRETIAGSGTDSLEQDHSFNETFNEMPQDHYFPTVYDAPVSPTTTSLHPLPPKPQGGQSTSSAPLPTAQLTTAQSQPRMRGGFELDDDADEDEDERDYQDSVAVYEPDDGLTETHVLEHNIDVAEDNAATPVQHDALDSTSKTPIQPNGLAHIPAHTNGVNLEAPGSVPSPNAKNNALSPQRASTATPMQTIAGSMADDASASLIVNTSNAPNVPSASAVPKGRLAHDVVGILEDRIKEDPRGDVLAWLELIDELKRRNKQDEVRRLYDRYFEVFPLAVCDPSYFSRPDPDFNRLNNGVITSNGRKKGIENGRWSCFFNDLYLKSQMSICGQSTSTTFDGGTACRLATSRRTTRSFTIRSASLSRMLAWTRTLGVCGKTILTLSRPVQVLLVALVGKIPRRWICYGLLTKRRYRFLPQHSMRYGKSTTSSKLVSARSTYVSTALSRHLYCANIS